MRKKGLALLMAATMMMTSLSACGKTEETANQPTTAPTEAVAETPAPTEGATPTPDQAAIEEAIKAEQESKANEEKEAAEPTPTNGPKEYHATVDTVMDGHFGIRFQGDCGTVEKIVYHANDYIGDGEGVDKKAFVYLPAGYDETKQYNVLYLMHGIGGNENEWGLNDANAKLKNILDNLFGRGEVEPFIVVTPNGKALGNPYTDATNSFYQFGLELRNDLIPYIESHYATYAEYNEDGYDLTATRTHRAMAGLSMGGMQTINIGICECLDIISWFGAFSAAPTSYAASKVAEYIDNSEYTVDYFYNICGTEDGIAYASSSNAAKKLYLYTDKIVDGENFMWMERDGGHDFAIWHLGLYNFAQLAFKTAE